MFCLCFRLDSSLTFQRISCFSTRVFRPKTLSLKAAGQPLTSISRSTSRFMSRFERSFSAKYQKESERKTREVRYISDRFHLHRSSARHQWSSSIDPQRVLVLLMPWLNAKQKHIDKYRDIYLGMGLDVLCMSSKLSDFLWPPNSMGAAENLLKILQGQCQDYDHYLFHSLSVGCYNFTVFQMLASEKGFSRHLLEHTHGIIYDSLVVGGGEGGIVKNVEPSSGSDSSVHAIDRMTRGISHSMTTNEVVHKCISLISKLYFSATKSKTLDFYVKVLDMVRDHPINVPTLIFGSRDDPMSDPNTIEQLVSIWKNNSNLDVQLQLWDSSSHAQHLIYHHKEYVQALNSFIAHTFGSYSLFSQKHI